MKIEFQEKAGRKSEREKVRKSLQNFIPILIRAYFPEQTWLTFFSPYRLRFAVVIHRKFIIVFHNDHKNIEFRYYIADKQIKLLRLKTRKLSVTRSL